MQTLKPALSEFMVSEAEPVEGKVSIGRTHVKA